MSSSPTGCCAVQWAGCLQWLILGGRQGGGRGGGGWFYYQAHNTAAYQCGFFVIVQIENRRMYS